MGGETAVGGKGVAVGSLVGFGSAVFSNSVVATTSGFGKALSLVGGLSAAGGKATPLPTRPLSLLKRPQPVRSVPRMMMTPTRFHLFRANTIFLQTTNGWFDYRGRVCSFLNGLEIICLRLVGGGEVRIGRKKADSGFSPFAIVNPAILKKVLTAE